MLDHPPIEQEQGAVAYEFSGQPKLEVGMRVRWRISGECGFKCPKCDLNWHLNAGSTGTGTIIRVSNSRGLFCGANGKGCGLRTSGYQGHHYGIQKNDDDPGFWAAASELMVVETEEGGERIADV